MRSLVQAYIQQLLPHPLTPAARLFQFALSLGGFISFLPWNILKSIGGDKFSGSHIHWREHRCYNQRGAPPSSAQCQPRTALAVCSLGWFALVPRNRSRILLTSAPRLASTPPMEHDMLCAHCAVLCCCILAMALRYHTIRYHDSASQWCEEYGISYGTGSAIIWYVCWQNHHFTYYSAMN